jgi:hypothetical protein
LLPRRDLERVALSSTDPADVLPNPDREHEWWAWWRANGQDATTRLLREQWNPIGDGDVPPDEYASYASRLGGLLREGVSADELARFLDEARTGAMGLAPEPDEDRRVAALVHDWYHGTRRPVE